MSTSDDKPPLSNPQKPNKQKAFTKKLGASIRAAVMSSPDSSTSSPAPATENRAGGLRSEITITLQTRAASKLWYGRRASNENGKHGLMGAVKFAALVRSISDAAAIDDPYADMWLLRLQNGLLEARARLNRYANTIEEFVTSRLPEGLTVGDALSVRAEIIRLQFATPFGYMAAYLVADFDKVARKVLLGRHIALLDTATSERMLFEGSKIVHFAISQVNGYQFTGVTRDDVTANNPSAQRAFQSMGKCPDDILRGEKRSDFAPANFKLIDLQGRNSASQEAVEKLAAITKGLDVESDIDLAAGADALDLEEQEG